MEVNRTWWDGATTIIDDGAATPTTLFEVYSNTMYSKINAETSDKYLGEWDKSICPWKINYEADFINPDFILAWNDGSNWYVEKSPLYKERKKGYTFYLSMNGSNYDDRYDRDKYGANFCPAWLGTLTASSYDVTDTVCNEWTESKYDRINPIINFNYSRLFVVPTVNGNPLNPNIESGFDPSTIYSLGFAFYAKNYVGSNLPEAMGIVSLNNTMAVPEWSDYATNSWNEEGMIDNGYFITPYWVEHTNLHPLPSMGTRPNWQVMPWRTSSEEFITGATGTGFSEATQSAQSAAATVNYFPNKAIYTSAGNGIFTEEYETYNGGGTYPFRRAVRRHLKSSVTYSDLVDYLALQCAYLGFRFCLDVTKINEDIDSEYFYIPEIDEKGVTTGVYYAANSASAAMLPNNTWTTNVYEQTPYDGSDDEEDDDPNTYDDNTTQLNTNWVNQTYSYFGLYYILDGAAMQSLHATLFSTYAAQITDSLKQCLTLNPIDVVKSLRMFPFDIASHIVTTTTGTIKLGGYDTGISSEQFTQYLTIIDAGYCTYHPEFNTPDDFREYEPYSSATLILPYCGSIDISPTLYLDKKITVKYVVDLQTGECLALIFRQDKGKEGDGMVVDSIGGHMAVDIPISGVNGAQIEAAQMQAATAYKNARNKQIGQIAAASMSGVMTLAAASNPATFAASAVTTGQMALNAASAANNVEEAKYQLDHINVPFVTRGQSSSATSYANEQRVRLIIKRPVMSSNYNEAEYGHNVGFATYDTATLDSYTGFTVCAAADTSGITATLRERALIKEMLLSGIYL